MAFAVGVVAMKPLFPLQNIVKVEGARTEYMTVQVINPTIRKTYLLGIKERLFIQTTGLGNCPIALKEKDEALVGME